MTLLDQIRHFQTPLALAHSLRAQNPGFQRTPELATLYSQSIMEAMTHQIDWDSLDALARRSHREDDLSALRTLFNAGFTILFHAH